MKITETTGKVTISEKRIALSTALTILITVVSLFAASAIVMGVGVRVAHPAVAALCGAGVLLMLARFVYSAVREAGAVQQWRFGCSLSLAVAFAFFALWGGCVPPVALLAILPLCVCAAILTATFSRIRGNAVLYVIAGGVGVWMLQLLLGLLGVLPFTTPHLYFIVVYVLAASFALGRSFVMARRSAACGAFLLAGYGTVLLLLVGCVLFGGYFSSLCSTLVIAVLLLATTALCFWDMGWYKRWSICVVAVLACVALVLNAGLLTGLFSSDGWEPPDPVALGGSYMIALIAYAAVALALAICKPFGKNIYARAALIAEAVAFICAVLLCGGLSAVGKDLVMAVASLLCLCTVFSCFAGARRNLMAWVTVMPVSAAALLLLTMWNVGGIPPFARSFFLALSAAAAVLIFAWMARIKRKRVNPFLAVCAVLLSNVVLTLALLGIFVSDLPIAYLLIAVLCAFIVYFLWEKARHKRVLLLIVALFGFCALILNALLLTGMAELRLYMSDLHQAPAVVVVSVASLVVMLAVGVCTLFLSALSDSGRSLEFCHKGTRAAVATRSLLSAVACVVCTGLLLFGGYIDLAVYVNLCVVVAAFTLALLIWRGRLLSLNLFAVPALASLITVVGNSGVIESDMPYATGVRDILITGVLVPLIPAVPGALILTLRGHGNIFKCKKARHAFACAVCSAVCLLLYMIGGRFTGFAKTAVCAVAIGMILFSVYAVFEKRSRY